MSKSITDKVNGHFLENWAEVIQERESVTMVMKLILWKKCHRIHR